MCKQKVELPLVFAFLVLVTHSLAQSSFESIYNKSLAPAYLNGVLSLKSRLLAITNPDPTLNAQQETIRQHFRFDNSNFGGLANPSNYLTQLETMYLSAPSKVDQKAWHSMQQQQKAVAADAAQQQANVQQQEKVVPPAMVHAPVQQPYKLSQMVQPQQVAQPQLLPIQVEQQQAAAVPSSVPASPLLGMTMAVPHEQVFQQHFPFKPADFPFSMQPLPEPQSLMPTAEQLQLLQQLQDFFLHPRPVQMPSQSWSPSQQASPAPAPPPPFMNSAQLTPTEAPDDLSDEIICPDDDEEQKPTTVKPTTRKTTKRPTAKPKTTTESSNDEIESVSVDIESDKKKTSKSKWTPKKLPCCTKPAKNKNVVSYPEIMQERTGRHANAFRTLLRYRQELSRKRRQRPNTEWDKNFNERLH